jgi:hypothetical protein
MIESLKTMHTGRILRLEEDYIQITPFFGYWLSKEMHARINQQYKPGDSITLVSDTATGFVTEIEEKPTTT